jgi:hypothetical protein
VSCAVTIYYLFLKLLGVFGWLAVNYLLHKIPFSAQEPPLQTVGALDLGGGSSQITFQLRSANLHGDIDKENVVQVGVGCPSSVGMASSFLTGVVQCLT